MISYLFVYLSDGFPSLPCFLFANVHRVFVAPSLLKILVSQRERTCSRALLMFTLIKLLDTCSSFLFRCHVGFFRLVPWLRFPLASVLTLNVFPTRTWSARMSLVHLPGLQQVIHSKTVLRGLVLWSGVCAFLLRIWCDCPI